MPLLDRKRQIPNGLRFYLPATRWQSTPWSSFDHICTDLLNHLKGNPTVAQKLGWPLDLSYIEQQVDEFNTRLCQQMGWKDFIVADGGATVSVPFTIPQKLRNVAAGGELLVEWLESDQKPVPIKVAEKRASICSTCPSNGKGDWTRYFTVPMASKIKSEIERRNNMKLSTSHDSKLNVCEVCLCPLKLKVHSPLSLILSKIPGEVKSRLPGHCWILNE